MNLPTVFLTLTWMIRDTFRQAIAARLFAVMLGVTFICTLFCLSVSATNHQRLDTRPGEDPMFLPPEDPLAKKLGPEKVTEAGVDLTAGSDLSFAFGAIPLTQRRDKTDAVRYVQVFLAGAVADTIGLLLALIWTAGFLPSFLDPAQVTVLLAKPVSRCTLFLGKVFGVLAFVGLQAILFVGCTWLALGLRTGVFDGRYLLTIPLLVLQFAMFYGFSALLAVVSRNAVVCVFGTLLFWFMCWGMNFGRHFVEVEGDQLPVRPVARTMLEIGYWTMPKPGDMSMILFDTIQAEGFTAKLPVFAKLQDDQKFRPELSVLASLLFSVAVLGIAAREFAKTDY